MATFVPADKTTTAAAAGGSGDRVRELFDQLDADGSNSLDKREVRKLAALLGEKLTSFMGLRTKKLDAAFAEMDVRKAGAVTFEEFRTWWVKTHPEDAPRAPAAAPLEPAPVPAPASSGEGESKTAVLAGARTAVPEGKLFDGIRKDFEKIRAALDRAGLSHIDAAVDFSSFLTHHEFTSLDQKKQAAVLQRLGNNLITVAGGGNNPGPKSLAGLSMKDDLVKQAAMNSIKSIVVRVDAENTQASTVGSKGYNFATVLLSDETIFITVNINKFASPDHGLAAKLLPAIPGLALQRSVRDANAALLKKSSFKTFEAKYGRALPVSFNCVPFESSPQFLALTAKDQFTKIERMVGCIDAALRAILKLAKDDPAFKEAFDKRVANLSFTYDPASTIKYKARNSTITVRWKAELQGSDLLAPTTLELTKNLDDSRGGLDNIKNVLEPALGIGVDEAELLAAAQAAEAAKRAAWYAKQKAEKEAAAEKMEKNRQKNIADHQARCAEEKRQRLQNMADSKALIEKRKEAHEAHLAQQAEKMEAAAERNAQRREEARAASAAKKVAQQQAREDWMKEAEKRKASYEARMADRAEKMKAGRERTAQRREEARAASAAKKIEQQKAKEERMKEVLARRQAKAAKEKEAEDRRVAAAERLQKQRDEARAVTEAKRAAFEQYQEEYAALCEKRKAARAASDENLAQKIAENMAKIAAQREVAKVEKLAAAARFAEYKAEREAQQERHSAQRAKVEAARAAGREEAAKKVEAARAARKKAREDRLAIHTKQREEAAAFRLAQQQRKKEALAAAASAREERLAAAAEAKALREAANAEEKAGRDAAAAAAKAAIAEARAKRAEERALKAEERATKSASAAEDAQIKAEELAASQAAALETADKEAAAAAKLEDEAIALGDGTAVFVEVRESSIASHTPSSSVEANSSEAVITTTGLHLDDMFRIQISDPPTEEECMAAEALHEANAYRVERAWRAMYTTVENATTEAELASQNTTPSKFGSAAQGQVELRREAFSRAGCVFENDCVNQFDYGVFKGTVFIKSAKDGDSAVPDTFGYCSTLYDLATHFPESLRCVYPDELRKVWTDEAFLDWATRLTAEMAEGALPNPPLTFEEPISWKPVSQTAGPKQGFWQYKNHVKENGLVRPIPAWTTDNLDMHPIWTMQVRKRCEQFYEQKKSLIRVCTNAIKEAHGIIWTQVSDINALEKPIEMARQNIEKEFAKAEKHQTQLEKLRADLEDGVLAKAEKEALIAPSEEAMKKATAAKAAAQDDKMANAALTKELAAEMKEKKKAVADAKNAKAGPEDMDAVMDAEASTKAKVAAAKAETKLIASRDKVANKMLNDAKAASRKVEAAMKSASQNVTRLTQNVENAERSLRKVMEKMERYKKTVRETYQKIATKRITIEENEAVLIAKQEEIKAHIAAVMAHIVDSREAEIQMIVEQHKNIRDAMLPALDGNLIRIQAIEKLRADRVKVHGEAELNRRVEQMARIVRIKEEENARRDEVNRDCVLCGKAVGNKNAAERHRKGAVWHHYHTGGKYEGKSWPGCPAVFNYYMAVYIAKTMDLGEGPPIPTFTTKEDVEHISCAAPMMDGSFWNSKYEKKTSLWKGHGKDSIALMEFYKDISMSPYSSWCWDFIGDFYDHQKLVKGGVERETGNGDGSKSMGAQFYATPWDPSTSQCSTPANPPGSRDIFEGGGEHVTHPRIGWERLHLQHKRPYVVNGKVGDRFMYLSMHHEWWGTVVPEELAKRCGCYGEGELPWDNWAMHAGGVRGRNIRGVKLYSNH